MCRFSAVADEAATWSLEPQNAQIARTEALRAPMCLALSECSGELFEQSIDVIPVVAAAGSRELA